MRSATILLTVAALAGSAVLATANQEDRRAAMKAIGASAKALSQGTDARANAATIAEKAAMIPVLFEANEITGDSKAKANIWESHDDFLAKGKALEDAASNLVTVIEAGGDVEGATKAMMGTCKGCHETYKSS